MADKSYDKNDATQRLMNDIRDFLIQAHEKGESSIDTWDGIALQGALDLRLSPYDISRLVKSLETLIQAHIDKRIEIKNLGKVALEVSGEDYSGDLMKLLIQAHEKGESKVDNWDEVAMKAALKLKLRNAYGYRLVKLLETLIQAHIDKRIEIKNLDELALKVSGESSILMELLIQAHEKGEITITNWDKMAVLSSEHPRSLDLLLKKHEDKSSTIKFTNPEAIKILEKHKESKCENSSIELWIQAHEKGEIKINNWNGIALQAALDLRLSPYDRSRLDAMLETLIQAHIDTGSKYLDELVLEASMKNTNLILVKLLIQAHEKGEITITNWDEVAMKVTLELESSPYFLVGLILKTLIQAHIDKRIEIKNLNQLALKVSGAHSGGCMELLIQAHEKGEIKIDNWDEVAIETATKVALESKSPHSYHPALKLGTLIQAHIDKRIEIKNLGKVALEVSGEDCSGDLMKLLIQAHEKGESKVDNWDEVAMKVAMKLKLRNSHGYRLVKSLETLIQAHIDKRIEIKNLDELALKVSGESSILMELLIQAHEKGEITITNWDKMAVLSSEHPRSLDLLLKKHEDKSSTIKFTNPEAIKILEKHKESKCENSSKDAVNQGECHKQNTAVSNILTNSSSSERRLR